MGCGSGQSSPEACPMLPDLSACRSLRHARFCDSRARGSCVHWLGLFGELGGEVFGAVDAFPECTAGAAVHARSVLLGWVVVGGVECLDVLFVAACVGDGPRVVAY